MSARDRDPVSRYTFDLFRDGLDQYHEGLDERLRQLEERLRDHERSHGADRSKTAVETVGRRKWSWPEIMVAIIAASSTVAAATITALIR